MKAGAKELRREVLAGVCEWWAWADRARPDVADSRWGIVVGYIYAAEDVARMEGRKDGAATVQQLADDLKTLGGLAYQRRALEMPGGKA